MAEKEKEQAEQLKRQGDVKEALQQADSSARSAEDPDEDEPPRVARDLGDTAARLSRSLVPSLRQGSLAAPADRRHPGAGKSRRGVHLPRPDRGEGRRELLRSPPRQHGRALQPAADPCISSSDWRSSSSSSSRSSSNWYTAVVSLGLISLILGFALQTPITSFIGWIYILVRKPYRVGDRIRIGEANGDVIDVSYLDTTLWEFGGEYLSTDHPSGRIIKFPNSNVLEHARLQLLLAAVPLHLERDQVPRSRTTATWSSSRRRCRRWRKTELGEG